MTTLFFTADTHFGHAAVIKHSKRPFSSVEVMDAVLIQRWNEVVQPNDEVWHLGDFNFRSKELTPYYRQQLNGRVHLIRGNHDDGYALKFQNLFASVQEAKYLRYHGVKLTLYHYAQRVWRNSHHGALHLYGHSHGSIPDYNRSMDVDVDMNYFRPIAFEEVLQKIGDRAITHHHPEPDEVSATG